MTAPWPKIPLADAGTWLSGGTPSKANQAFWSGPIPWVSPKDMKRPRIGDAEDHVSPEAARKGTQLVPPDTLLMVVRGMILAHTFPVAVTTAEVTFNQDIKALRPRPGIDPCFLLYWLQSMEQEVLRRVDVANHGTRRLPTERLMSFMMPVPTLAEQEAIVALLRAVDDATTADEAVVEQLDRVRQDLVEDLLQHGLPGTGGGTPQWKQGTLGEYLREPIRNGYSPVCPSEPTGRWTLGLGAVTPEGFNPGGKKPAPVDDPHVQAAKLEHGDVLVSRSNTRERVGLAGVYRSDPPDSSYPDLMMRVRPAESLLPEFLECQLLAAGGRRYFEASARGTSGSMVKINRRILEAFPVVIPPLGEQRKVIAALGAVAERVAKERAVVAERRRLKAALTDALLTGTIRIPGVNGA